MTEYIERMIKKEGWEKYEGMSLYIKLEESRRIEGARQMGTSGILGGLESQFSALSLSWPEFPQLCLGGLRCFKHTGKPGQSARKQLNWGVGAVVYAQV